MQLCAAEFFKLSKRCDASVTPTLRQVTINHPQHCSGGRLAYLSHIHMMWLSSPGPARLAVGPLSVRNSHNQLMIALLRCQLLCFLCSCSPQSVHQQQTEEVFALLSSLIDAAERLRQFSPVKEHISTAVLEEVRFRLYRIVSAPLCGLTTHGLVACALVQLSAQFQLAQASPCCTCVSCTCM